MMEAKEDVDQHAKQKRYTFAGIAGFQRPLSDKPPREAYDGTLYENAP
jgi:hypothetical protein